MLLPDDFFLPFGGKLNKNNRWVKLTNLIPWWKEEDQYKHQLKNLTQGATLTRFGWLLVPLSLKKY
jgi:hypothetical protein